MLEEEDKMICEYEGHNGECSGKVTSRGSMTAYHFEGVRNSEEDPNRDFVACDLHYEDYYSFWKEQWDEYNGMVYEGIVEGQRRNETRYLEDSSPSFQEQFEDFASRVKFE